jgi:hypothetical protein
VVLGVDFILALNGDAIRGLPLSMRKTNLDSLLARRPDGIFVAPFEPGEIGPDLFRAACNMGLEGWCRSDWTGPIKLVGRRFDEVTEAAAQTDVDPYELTSASYTGATQRPRFTAARLARSSKDPRGSR